MRPLSFSTSLWLAYTAILAVAATALGVVYHSALVRQLDASATAGLSEKARALHAYLQFHNGSPELVYDRADPDEAAFVNDATRFYQVYDGTSGRLLAQSPGMESLGLHFTPAEIAEFRASPSTEDVQTDRGRLRVVSTLVSPRPGEAYLVQVGSLLDAFDRALAGFDGLLLWRIGGGLIGAALVGRWLAARAVAPLSRLAVATHGIGISSLDERLPLRGARDELDQVADAFNRALARVEQSVGEMRQFSAALAHELRTPIAILRAQAERELAHPVSGDERQARLASQVEEYDRLTRLINQILTLARAEAGEIRLSTQDVKLGALASTVSEQVEPVASARNIVLTCQVEDDPTVAGDAGWLGRLLLILVDNAIKYTPDGGRVSVRVSSLGDAALLTVADTGVGIAPDALPHVFERFYRVDGARTRQTPGSGLGLALAKWIAEGHGGTIDASSTVGEGSSFVVRLRTASGSPRLALGPKGDHPA